MIIQEVRQSIRKSGKNIGKPYYQIIMSGGAKYLSDDDLNPLVGKEVTFVSKDVGDSKWMSNVREKAVSAPPQQAHDHKEREVGSYAGKASSFACSYAKDTVNEVLKGVFQHMSPMDTEIIKKTMEELRPVVADNLAYYMELYEEKMK